MLELIEQVSISFTGAAKRQAGDDLSLFLPLLTWEVKHQSPSSLDATIKYTPEILTWNLKMMISNRESQIAGVHFQVPCEFLGL